MDQLIGLFGQFGPFDLAIRPDANARMALPAVTISGKKGLFGQIRVPRQTRPIQHVFSGPGHGFQWSRHESPKEGPKARKVSLSENFDSFHECSLVVTFGRPHAPALAIARARACYVLVG